MTTTTGSTWISRRRTRPTSTCCTRSAAASPPPIRSTTCSSRVVAVRLEHRAVRLVLHLRAGGGRPGAARLEDPASRRRRSAEAAARRRASPGGWPSTGSRWPSGSHAFEDPRFQTFNELPEDRYEAFLSVPVLSRGKLVGVINLQHRQPHDTAGSDIQLISMIGFLVGAEIEMARLEAENTQLSERLETRKVRRSREGHPAARPGHHRGGGLPHDSAPEPAAAQVEEGDRRGDRARRRAAARQRVIRLVSPFVP